ncbi:endonuclease MutS2 [Streptococcus parasanguinis]|uniref:endonuclease MutS2 n=1 Tax=Streptococcus parasanguinis TaxID=1318 RepID=UPI0039C2C6A5
MNKKILDILEFDKVKQLFEPYLQTEQGEMELAALTPTDKKESIETAFMELEDMEQILLEEPRFAVSTIQDVRPVAKRLEMEASLNIDELLALKAVLRVTHELKDFYDNLENVRLERLNRLFDNLVDLPRLQGGLQAINEGGFVESFASEKLAKIRRRIQENEHQVREILQDLLKSKADMLADAVIASRNGRNVLPVKNTYRNRIAGVVHDISASGNTVYIEPRAVVNLNEEIANHRADERYEIIQILEELSDTLRPHAAEIANNAWIIGHLDLIKAKYRFMRDCKAVVPEVSNNRSIQLLQLRHPLIENAVANDLHFTEDLTEIVITGPNTGGKTIMLKTLGLAQIMAQSGLPILADPGSRVGIFSQVFADIGDEQSIEQSLSTFSSHMTNIVSILHQVDTASLILLDELGAGTDPQEGAGLAIAILEDLRLRGIKTMATTHYPELKAYGIETAGVQNASMEFDTASLRPTYRFMQGVPGRSNAFEIARRLGLSETIIQDAMKMTNTDNDVNQIIEKLEAQTLESRKRLDTIQEVEQENLKFNRALRKLYNELTRERETELNKAREEAKEIVDMALSESDRILQGLHAKSQLKPHEIIEAKAQLKKLAPEIVDLSKNKVLKKAKKARAPKVGDEILVISYGQRGTLVKQLKDGRWEAQVGLIKMTLEEKEFNLIKAEKEATQPKKRQVNVVKRSNTSGPRARLDLRGKRYEEAMQELDGFIDQALLNNMAQVDIIHGIGTGVIREGVTKYLRRNKHVKSFEYAPQNAGGSGATIVTFKG